MNAPVKPPLKTVSSTEAQNNFGKLIDDAKQEPIMIQKNGRDQAVILSAEEFNRIASETNVNPLVKSSLERSLKRWDKLYEALAR